MKRNTAGERARKALRRHWTQALAWEGAVLCATAGVAITQGIAAMLLHIPAAIPTPAVWQTHPQLFYIVAGGWLLDFVLISPIRFGRTAFYAGRASAWLPTIWPDPPEMPAARCRHGKEAVRGLYAALRRLWRGRRHLRMWAGRLLWQGWNLLGAAPCLSPAIAAFWLSGNLSPSAAPYALWLAALGWPLTVAGLLLWAMWSLRLSPLMVLLAAHPRWNVRRAAQTAFAATRGRVLWIARRMIGFFGWFSTCLAVIPLAYVAPLYATAQAEWCLRLASEAEKQKALCKAGSLYTRRVSLFDRSFTWPAKPAGRLPLRRSRAE